MNDLLTTVLAQGTSPFAVIGLILRNGGLAAFFPIFIWMMWVLWKDWIQNVFSGKRNFVLLAIDIPRLEDQQSMKAVEHVLTALYGALESPNRKQKYWDGVIQTRYGLEIVSIDGYIQYFIYVQDTLVDLMKGAVFAQYPDAEIVEVEDYVPNVPHKFPNDDWEMWGTELVQMNSDIYPIKTYERFEHTLTGVFADPLANLLELMSRLRPGEQVWLSIVVTPTGFSWRQRGLKEVDALIGKFAPPKKSITDYMVDVPIKTLQTFSEAIFNPEGIQPNTEEPEEGSAGNFLNMTTGEKMVVEEVQKKLQAIPYEVKMRFIYLGKKEVFNPGRVVTSFFGALAQFSLLDMNGITAGIRTWTGKPTYLFAKRRQNIRKNKLMAAQKSRSNWLGEARYIMSHTELATLYHFPDIQVRAPLLSRTQGKKGLPPANLPITAGTPFEQLRSGGTAAAPDPADALAQAAVLDAAGAPQLASLAHLDPTAAVPTVPVSTPAPEPIAAPPPDLPGVFPAVEDGGQQTVAVNPDMVGQELHSLPGLPPGIKPIAKAQRQPGSVSPQSVLVDSIQPKLPHPGPTAQPPSNLPI